MAVIAHKHSPVLGWIRVLVNLLLNHPAKTRLLGKPLASKPRDRMPANLDGAVFSLDVDLARGDDVGFVAQSERMLEVEFSLKEFLLAL